MDVGKIFDSIFHSVEIFFGIQIFIKLVGYCITMHCDNFCKSSNEIAEAANKVFWKTVNQRFPKRRSEVSLTSSTSHTVEKACEEIYF